MYRLGKFDKCYSGYVDLIKNSSDQYEDERYVNLIAALAGLFSEKQDSSKSDLLDLKETSFEIVYNKACILIANGLYEEAIRKLNEAEGNTKSKRFKYSYNFCFLVLGFKSLEEEGATEEEIENELAIIKVQIAFCHQKLGKKDFSLKLYNQILRQKYLVCYVNMLNIYCSNLVFFSYI